MSTAPLPSIEQYLVDHPDADPATMLQVLLQKNRSTESEISMLREEYRVSSEVEMDVDFQFKPKSLAQLQRLARMYSESESVPEQYRGKLADTAIAVQMALRCRVDIMTFLQSSYVVYGKPGIEGKLVIAMLNCSDAIDGRVEFEPTRDEKGKVIAMRASAIDSHTGKTLSSEVTWDMVVAEGWDKPKKGQTSKWVTLPEQMFCYRSAAFLARAHFPDILFGMHTVDELEDIAGSNGQSGNGAAPAASNSLDELSGRMGAAPQSAGKKGRKALPAETHSEPAREAETVEADKTPEIEAPPAKTQGKAARVAVAPASATLAAEKTSPPAKTAPAAANGGKSRAKNFDACHGYLINRYEDDCSRFNMEQLCKEAEKSADSFQFIDDVMGEKAPKWERFLVPEPEADTDIDPDDPEDLMEEGGEIEPEEASQLEYITHPESRPRDFGDEAIKLEKYIIGKRSFEQIRIFANGDDLDQNPHLMSDERSYLRSLALRRAYQLEHNLTTTDRAP